MSSLQEQPGGTEPAEFILKIRRPEGQTDVDRLLTDPDVRATFILSIR